MYNSIHLKEFDIYDIYHNDNNNLVIISPCENEPLTIKYDNDQFNLFICPHKHTYVYVLEKSLSYEYKINININNRNIETCVNKYPEFKNEIILSTMVYNEDNIILQWIKFHHSIGIKRFIIYDNSKSDIKNNYSDPDAAKSNSLDNSNLTELLSYYINEGIVILIDWPYTKYVKKSGISGQTTQQNHSVWAFKNSKYIGLFDVDEYINIQHETNIEDFFNNLTKEYNININELGSFRLLNRFFHNPYNLPTDNFKFLKIYACEDITPSGNEKNFVIPRNVYTFSVHMITMGKNMYNISHKKIYFNHYIYLNKIDRGHNETQMIDYSINKHTKLIL
jgi:hypothetical protein